MKLRTPLCRARGPIRASKTGLAIGLCILSALSLSACEDSQQALSGADDDWIQNPTDDGTSGSSGASGTPAPVPTPAPTAAPVPASDLYTGPAEFAPYVQKFVDDAAIQGVNVVPKMKSPVKLVVRLASLDSWGSSVIGLCETGSNIKRVTFDPDFWNSVSETQRELVAHHEFGHCVLYRPHRSELLSSGKYSSIMYPIIMSSSTYASNYDYYQNELFTYSTSAIQQPDADGVVRHVCD